MGRFIPGISGNPNGRPKDVKCLPTVIRARACKDFDERYNRLIEFCDKGEYWANNIYFNTLLPKKYREDSFENLLKTNEINNNDDAMRNMREMLSAPESFTLDEIISIKKVLSRIKMAENIESANLAEELSDEKLKAIIDIINKEDKPQNNEL